jgi:hypothetical protein
MIRSSGFAYGQPLKRLAALQWATETGMSTSRITAPAEDASPTRTGKPSPTAPSNGGFHRSFGFQDAADTAAWHGSTTAGTPWHGCN